MFCTNCGHEIPDNSKFCPVCGAKQVVEEPKKAVPVKKGQNSTAQAGGMNLEITNWVMIAAAFLTFISVFMPMVKITINSYFYSDSESYTLSKLGEIGDIGGLKALAVFISIFAIVTIVMQFMKKSIRKWSAVAALACFVFVMILVGLINSEISKSYYFDTASLGGGAILMIISSIVLAALGILNLVKKN